MAEASMVTARGRVSDQEVRGGVKGMVCGVPREDSMVMEEKVMSVR